MAAAPRQPPWRRGGLPAVAMSILLLVVGCRAQDTYVEVDGSCDLSWTTTPYSRAECLAAAQARGYAGPGAALPGDLVLPDAALIAPKSELPRTCILLRRPEGLVLYWNYEGTNTAPRRGDDVITLCRVTGTEPTTLAPVIFPPTPTPSATRVPRTAGPPATPGPPATGLTRVPDGSRATLMPATGTRVPETLSPRGPQPTRTPATALPPPAPTGPTITRITAQLGVNSTGACEAEAVLNVPDAQRSASTTWQGCAGVPCPGVPGQSPFHQGKLDSMFGWSAAGDGPGQYYEMDAGEGVLMVGVVLQGGLAPSAAGTTEAAWVTQARIAMSEDRVTWRYADEGTIYDASSDLATRVFLRVGTLTYARYVRVYPVAWSGWPALRAGVLVCAERDVHVRTITIDFDRPTQLGLAAEASNSTNPRDSGFAVLSKFGVLGYKQTLGRPEGFYGTWDAPDRYVIEVSEFFTGYIDPAAAKVYLLAGSDVRGVDGSAPTIVGPSNAVRFAGVFQLPVATGAPPGGGETVAPVDDGGDDIPWVEIALIALLLLILLVPLCYWVCRDRCRANEANFHHEKYIEEGTERADAKYPGGRTALKHQRLKAALEEPPVPPLGPRSPSPENPIGHAFPTATTTHTSSPKRNYRRPPEPTMSEIVVEPPPEEASPPAKARRKSFGRDLASIVPASPAVTDGTARHGSSAFAANLSGSLLRNPSTSGGAVPSVGSPAGSRHPSVVAQGLNPVTPMRQPSQGSMKPTASVHSGAGALSPATDAAAGADASGVSAMTLSHPSVTQGSPLPAASPIAAHGSLSPTAVHGSASPLTAHNSASPITAQVSGLSSRLGSRAQPPGSVLQPPGGSFVQDASAPQTPASVAGRGDTASVAGGVADVRSAELASVRSASTVHDAHDATTVCDPATGTPRPPSVSQTPAPAPTPRQDEEEDELAGVDWRLTVRTLNQQVLKLQDQLKEANAAKKVLEQDKAELQTSVSGLETKVEELQAELDVTVQALEAKEEKSEQGKDEHGEGKVDKPAEEKGRLKHFKMLAQKREAKIKELEKKLAAAETPAPAAELVAPITTGDASIDEAIQARDRVIADLQRQVADADARANSNTVGQANAVSRQQVDQLRVAITERDAVIACLEDKLRVAQAAIVSATDYGWENDIKLAQARRALLNILDHHSPSRKHGAQRAVHGGAHSPPRAAASPEQQRQALRVKRQEEIATLTTQVAALEKQKAQAIRMENYDEAKRLRAAETKLKEEIAVRQRALHGY